MPIYKKIALSVAIISISANLTYAQCLGFLFDPDKWGVNTNTNSSLVLSSLFGSGWEIGYGGGLELAPFGKVLYFAVNVNHVHQFLKDNSPNHNIFTSMPYKTEMKSRFLRTTFGAKVRINWWSRSNVSSSQLIIGYNFVSDFLLKETTDLYHNNEITVSNRFYSPSFSSGSYFEVGYSLKISNDLRWDTSLYLYYQLNQDILASVYSNDKIAVGINTGFYISF